jgi:hypothetical protein
MEQLQLGSKAWQHVQQQLSKPHRLAPYALKQQREGACSTHYLHGRWRRQGRGINRGFTHLQFGELEQVLQS